MSVHHVAAESQVKVDALENYVGGQLWQLGKHFTVSHCNFLVVAGNLATSNLML